MIFADTETHPIDRGALAPRPVCAQWAVDDGPVHLALAKDAPDFFGDTVVGANFAFDAAVLAAQGDLAALWRIFRAYDEGRVIDVQLDANLLDIAAGEYEHRTTRGWGLQELARRAGLRIDKDSDDATGAGSWLTRFAALAEVPVEHWPELARQYAMGDVEATRRVYLWTRECNIPWGAQKLNPLGWHSKHAACSALALHLASCQGMLTDPGRVETYAARVEGYLSELSADLQAQGLVREDGSRNTVAAARMLAIAYERQGRDLPLTDGAAKKEEKARERLEKERAKPPARTQAGRDTQALRIAEIEAQWHGTVHLPGVQCDKDAAILSGDETLIAYADYTGASLIRGRVERMRKGTILPLQTRFDPLKETARTSSTQPAEPLEGDQTQNYPRASALTRAEKARERKGEFFVGLRELYRPRDGYDFIGADINMAELHCLSEVNHVLFGYSRMGELLSQGIDLHWQFAAASVGKNLEDVARKNDRGEWKAVADEWKEHRDRAKPANFGFPGGMGPDKFILYARKGYGVRFERDEVVELKRRWLETFPEVKEYLRWISRQMGDAGHFTSVHPITGYVRGGCGYTEGANHHFQHLCAYGAKEALWEVTKACFDPRNPLYGSRPVNFIHDEIVAESPCDRSAEAAEEMGRIITDVFNRYVPHYPTKAEGMVMRMWSKKAKAVRDASGRLVAWCPEGMAA